MGQKTMSLFDSERKRRSMNPTSTVSSQLKQEYDALMGSSETKHGVMNPLPHTEEVSQDNEEFQPQTLDEFQGQNRVKSKLKKYMTAAMINNRPMMHVMIAGKAGQGKTTLCTIVARELGVNVFWEGAPIHRERLLELSQEMQDGDIMMIDEVHLQAKGRTAGASPEMLYHIMENFKIITLNQGIIDFPRISVFGATTDEGLLPASFKGRFPLKITLDDYTDDELSCIARLNAKQLGVNIDDNAASLFASASLSTPREINNFMKQAGSLSLALAFDGTTQPIIDFDLAKEVLDDDGREYDGLKKEMMLYLEGLWDRRRWSKPQQQWVIKASLATMAHVIGRARDRATVEHDIEPVLIQRNLVDIVPGGRTLTPHGMNRINVKFDDPPIA